MKRGEIYYIKNDFGQIGHEIKKDRPAIIVSNDGYNEKSGMVTVVYLTRTPREDLLSHVTIRSTGRTSEALCEQISTISASRVNRYIGTVTDDEMRRIEAAIQIHLAMSAAGQEKAEKFARGGSDRPEPVTDRPGKAYSGRSGAGHASRTVRSDAGKNDEGRGDGMKAYIAGKIAGDPNYKEKFERAEQYMKQFGMIVLNPACLPGDMAKADYMRICFAMIDSADTVVLLDDWQGSPGARLEKAYCDYIGKHTEENIMKGAGQE